MAEEARAAVRRDWPEPLELQRRDLLTARRRRLRRTLQCRVPLQRLLVVARLREEVEAEEVAGYHRKLFEDASEYYIREQVSGLLLLSSSRVLHVVESCSSTMHFLIRALASLQNQGPSALLQEIKVLVVAHNIPSRLFLRWDVAVVTSPVTRPEDSMQSQSIEEVVAECLTLLINVADYVLKSAEDDSKASSDSLHTLAPELLIPAGTIGCLCKAEECASPVDFLRMYLSPVQPVLDSEAVWPIPLHLSA
uniref:SPOC domain-containing protein n=1 Tax=Pavo cristatus TaxID=9049 RepID=A0A8C9F2K5_PAVCR